MKTIAEVVRYLQAYNVGGRSAKCLRAALLKRIETRDPTDEIVEQLTFRTAQELLALYGSIEGIRERLDDVVSFMRYMELPFADIVFHVVSRLDWDRIADAFDELKPVEVLDETEFMGSQRNARAAYEKRAISRT